MNRHHPAVVDLVMKSDEKKEGQVDQQTTEEPRRMLFKADANPAPLAPQPTPQYPL